MSNIEKLYEKISKDLREGTSLHSVTIEPVGVFGRWYVNIPYFGSYQPTGIKAYLKSKQIQEKIKKGLIYDYSLNPLESDILTDRYIHFLNIKVNEAEKLNKIYE
jgi:hypothetical protein